MSTEWNYKNIIRCNLISKFKYLNQMQLPMVRKTDIKIQPNSKSLDNLYPIAMGFYLIGFNKPVIKYRKNYKQLNYKSNTQSNSYLGISLGNSNLFKSYNYLINLILKDKLRNSKVQSYNKVLFKKSYTKVSKINLKNYNVDKIELFKGQIDQYLNNSDIKIIFYYNKSNIVQNNMLLNLLSIN